MLAVERQRRILDLVQNQGSVRTTELAQVLGVTEETVRRDFEKLEQEGQVLRAHGGATRLEASRRDLPLSSRETENVQEKQRIAGLALRWIEPGDTVLFDASSTVFELARLLPDMSVTVVTSALKVAVELSSRPSVQVVLTGGVLSHRSLSCQGALADQALECYHIEKAFLSCRGVDVERGLSEANEEQARLKRRMMELSDHVYLLCDGSKMGLKSSFYFAKLSEVGSLITDREPEMELKQKLTLAGVAWHHG
ncbi:MAG: DeoR/GlpR transcriptional regulator [Blastochloris sp.]|nr:DeoR/GlpR transcriptional regulator [Blastochloris sp.]